MPDTAPAATPAIPPELFGDAAKFDAEAEIRRILKARGYNPDAGSVADGELADLAEPDPSPEAWRIRSQGEADWAMAKLGVAQRHQAQLDQQLADMVENAQAWRARAGAWADRDAAFFDMHLRLFALAQRHASPTDSKGTPRAATLHTRFGRVGTRAGARGVVEILDQAALTTWAREQAPHVVRERYDVQVSTLTEYIEVGDDGVVRVAIPDGNGEMAQREVPAGLVRVYDKDDTAAEAKVDQSAVAMVIEAGQL